jgi:hypothetical protein
MRRAPRVVHRALRVIHAVSRVAVREGAALAMAVEICRSRIRSIMPPSGEVSDRLASPTTMEGPLP